MNNQPEAARALAAWRSQFPAVPIADVRYLDGGYSNANFRCRDQHGQAWVVRVPHKPRAHQTGADCEGTALRLAAAHGMGPEVVHHDPATGVLITREIPGDAIGDLPPAQWPAPAVLGELLAQLHELPANAGSTGPCPSPARRVENWLRESRARSLAVPGGADELLAACQPREQRWCHADLNPWNIVRVGHRQWLIDWEWSGIGDPRFDLANLILLFDYGPAAGDQLLAGWSAARSPAPPVDRQSLQPWIGLVRLRELLWAGLALADGHGRAEIVAQYKQRWRELTGGPDGPDQDDAATSD